MSRLVYPLSFGRFRGGCLGLLINAAVVATVTDLMKWPGLGKSAEVVAGTDVGGHSLGDRRCRFKL